MARRECKPAAAVIPCLRVVPSWLPEPVTMVRASLYSRSPQRPASPAALQADPAAPGAAPPSSGQPPDSTPAGPGAGLGPGFRQRLQDRARRHRQGLWLLAALAGLTLAGWPAWTARIQRPLTIEQIDAALRDSISKQPLDAAGVAAYQAILPSVVRVVGHSADDAAPAAKPGAKGDAKADDAGKPGARTAAPKAVPGLPPGHPDPDHNRSVGTGVVIVDKGLILTSLHVVGGAQRITVTFFDGSQSEATVVSRQPENDLAVLQAHTIPDDLHAATLRSTAGLAPGEAVLAVGFPFGIGPSASQGVVSGLKREFRSPEGERFLTNLIQFDAAANPGNSGGPLVTMDGHVVGIVAAIMNPNQQRTFIGIGFAVPIENAAAAVGMPPF